MNKFKIKFRKVYFMILKFIFFWFRDGIGYVEDIFWIVNWEILDICIFCFVMCLVCLDFEW